MEYREKYNYWLEDDYFDKETKDELRDISDESEIEDRFYKDLTFGTAGLRGKIGAGTNRMNKYTVSLAFETISLSFWKSSERIKLKDKVRCVRAHQEDHRQWDPHY